MAKRIMLDDLAVMVQRGFLEIKDELRDFREENGAEHGNFQRKLDATITVTDRQEERIRRLETHVGLPH